MNNNLCSAFIESVLMKEEKYELFRFRKGKDIMEEVKDINKKSNHIVSVSIFAAINFVLVLVSSIFIYKFDQIRNTETGLEGLGLIPLLIIGLFILGIFTIIEIVLMIISLCFSLKNIKEYKGKIKIFHILMVCINVLICLANIFSILVLFDVF